jgi:hypothetical protein
VIRRCWLQGVGRPRSRTRARRGRRLATLLLLCGLNALGCGRLGFGLANFDAGERADAAVSGKPPGRPPLTHDAGSLDAGHHLVVDAGRIGTGQPTLDASAADAAASDAGPKSPGGQGSVCADASECRSGACVASVCCESACSEPPACRTSVGATCASGTCTYPSQAGATCDDGDPCTNDVCLMGTCVAFPRYCGDLLSCTIDYCAAAGSCSHVSSCDPMDVTCSYALQGGHGYWSCPMTVTYAAANSECQRLGTQLVTIDNQAEQDFLWAQGMRDTWIGYTNVADAGWSWSGDDKSTYVDWASGEPDGGPDDSCANLAVDQGGAWETHACSDAFSGFVCEIEQNVPPDAHCKYARYAGHGYFMCDSARGWLDARAHCRAIGAQLAEIDDAAEQTFLSGRLSGATSYAVGLSDAVREGQFLFGSGGTPTYFDWGSDQPNSSDPALDYVVLADDDTWHTVTSTEPVYFVCELGS